MCYNLPCTDIVTKGVNKINKLATIRKERGLSQEQLSALSGVHRVLISKYENGSVAPTVRNLQRLSDALKVPVDELIDRKGA